MEFRHFVYGKFSSRFPEFGTMVAGPAHGPEVGNGDYKAVQEFIINKLDALLYGHIPFSFSVLPEVLWAFKEYTLYIRFFPPLPDQRGTLVAPLFHCFLLDEADLKAIDYSPWKLRSFFVKQYEELSIIGHDGSVWLSQEEANRGGQKTIGIEMTAASFPASNGQLVKPGRYQDYYNVVARDAIATLASLEPEQKMSLFASGILLNGNAELLQRFSNKSIHFVFTDLREDQGTATAYNQVSGTQLGMIAPDEPAAEKEPVVMPAVSQAAMDRPKISEAQYPEHPVVGPGINNHNKEREHVDDLKIVESRFSEENKLRLSEYEPVPTGKLPEDGGTKVERIESGNASDIQFRIGNENIFTATIIISKSAVDIQDALCDSFQIKGRSEREFTDTKVEEGKSYIYQVKSMVNDTETIQTFLVTMPPRPISQLNHTRSHPGAAISLEWTASLNDFPVIYRLVRTTTDHTGKVEQYTEMVPANSYTDNYIPENAASIKYRINAENETTGQAGQGVETSAIEMPNRRRASEDHLSPADTSGKFLSFIKRKRNTLIIAGLLLIVAALVCYILSIKAGTGKEIRREKGGTQTIVHPKQDIPAGDNDVEKQKGEQPAPVTEGDATTVEDDETTSSTEAEKGVLEAAKLKAESKPKPAGPKAPPRGAGQAKQHDGQKTDPSTGNGTASGRAQQAVSRISAADPTLISTGDAKTLIPSVTNKPSAETKMDKTAQDAPAETAKEKGEEQGAGKEANKDAGKSAATKKGNRNNRPKKK
ncbi:hypothetical protein [Taibaiella koreensis]|uniref:hypothetical protein n=1 Tax=Taibaiella koreensis TaxID=1268548 RepID=UPI000E59CCEC|nr:hypothetical protein [Taibaiella koreensis]